jgi:hypothetical protein
MRAGRRNYIRKGSGLSKVGLVLEEKTLRGFSAGRCNDKSIKRPAVRASSVWSGREDSNLRPLRPERSALPGCATPRQNQQNHKASKDCLTSEGRNASHGLRPPLDR